MITVIVLLGFVMPANPPVGNWYQQFMPSIGGRQIKDIFFLDSLKGWAVTPFAVQNDTTFVLKTTNSGDTWFKIFTGTGQFVGRNRIIFLNSNTGFSCGNDHFSGSTKITKTTDGGTNWTSLNDPSTAVYEDMAVLNENMIWLVSSSSLTGGVYYTSDGGSNWIRQLDLGPDNPNKIYMFNANLGFITEAGSGNRYVRRTTDGGFNWTQILTNDDFREMFFTNSSTGWKCSVFGMKKTTDSGLSWVTQTLPYGGMIQGSGMTSFSVINKDTVFGCGGYLRFPNNQTRDIIYRTINGGTTWLFQIPDTSINIVYYYMRFADKLNGWAWGNNNRGIHTTTGGDPIWLTGIKQVSSETPREFKLYQNYPNPFNPVTVISYQLAVNSVVKLSVYDIQGKHIIDLVNQKQKAGSYQVDFSGSGYSSGVYFYKLIIGGSKEAYIETKKMILVK